MVISTTPSGALHLLLHRHPPCPLGLRSLARETAELAIIHWNAKVQAARPSAPGA